MNRAVLTFGVAAAVGAAISTGLARGAATPEVVLDSASSASLRPPTEPALPPGEGRSLVERRCGVCHALGLVLQQRLSAEAWKSEVKKMRSWGAFMDDDEAAKVTLVLASTLGKDGPLYVPGQLDPLAAESTTHAEPATGPRGNALKGVEPYMTNCAPCHGPAAEGARGPALRGRPIAAQPARFAAVVREGRGDMPRYPSFDDAALADLFAFVTAP